jgi:AmmeMemoRadiSam system protein B
MERTHKPPTCGRWYPDDAAELHDLLARTFETSQARIRSRLPPGAAAYVVPHAAPMYSGVVAAAAYRSIAACPPRFLIIAGFSHSGGPDGVSIPDVDSYRIPSGAIAVQSEMARELAGCEPFHLQPESRLCDHSVEIQLPFVGFAFEHMPVLPLYVGRLSRAQRFSAGRRIASLLGENAVLIASSDCTHFGRGFGYLPCAPDRQAPDYVRDLDRRLFATLATLEEDRFFEALRDTGSTLCGSAPIALLLAVVRSLARPYAQRELDYQTSAEISGDFGEFVSYAALAYAPVRRDINEDGPCIAE